MSAYSRLAHLTVVLKLLGAFGSLEESWVGLLLENAGVQKNYLHRVSVYVEYVRIEMTSAYRMLRIFGQGGDMTSTCTVGIVCRCRVTSGSI
ncbi:hypothetical protein B0H10DRAFT_2044668 [Mycena sp. CBHHK59/15]|nr:hypothetical protein B0H10DRAFT_2044668 [Mycena sp. CBHHK59/15]